MKKLYTAIAAAMLTMTTAVIAEAQTPQTITSYTFADTNPLATGHWVKISVNGSGMYEIPYERLREMGFGNPQQVAIYGTGGRKRDMNFLDSGNRRLVEDVISAIPATHRDGKLIFYAQGDRVLEFSSYQAGVDKFPSFRRKDLNPYSETTYFMLTDSHPGVEIETRYVTDKQNSVDSRPYAYIYHEAELFNGPHNSGEIWLGENLAAAWTEDYSERRLDFDIEAKYCAPNLDTYAYATLAVNSGYAGRVGIQINDVSRTYSLTSLTRSIYQNWENVVGSTPLNVDANQVGTGHLAFTLSGWDFQDWATLSLDYWTFVYPTSLKYLENDPDFTQFHIGINHDNTAKWRHRLPSGACVWDITNPLAPFQLDVENNYFYGNSKTARSLMVFNPSITLKQINADFEQVANQDLHALKGNAYDMVIFTLAPYKKYADRLAQLHANTDGQRVCVVVDKDMYNEFNAGTPDAMCYRLMAKMLYHHPEQSLKNVLFFGPVHGDFRNLNGCPDRIDGMIAFQDNYPDLRSCSNPDMDYYGIMADYLSNTDYLDKAPITLGVGMLPISNDQDAELILDKIRAHLEKKDFSGMVNETYSIGCSGDLHVHENQAIGIGTLIQNIANSGLDSEFAHETLWLDAMTSTQGRDLIKSAMRRGKSLLVYLGHAGESGFNAMNYYDAMTAGNNEQGVALFAGCDLLSPDRGIHGMGDMPVIRSRSGFLGIISATRQVLSNENEIFARNFTSSFFFDHRNLFRSSTPTIGEVYARAKERTENNSEKAYVFIGDPSLRIPIALSKVRLEIPDRRYRMGETVEVIGSVVDNETETVRTDYNGYVTLKLMEPSRMVTTTVASPTDRKMDDYAINDLPILAVNGEVHNGRFRMKVPLPARVESFASDSEDAINNLTLLAGTYDDTSYLGGSGRVKIPMAVFDSEPAPGGDPDTRAPMATVQYDSSLGVIKVTATDDVALRPGIGPGSGISLFIDGQEMLLSQEDYSESVYVTSYSGSVDMARLSNGLHTAKVIATDMAGNASEPKTLEFTVSTSSQISLQAANHVAVDAIDFTLLNAEGKTLTLLVVDTKGKVVAEEDIEGGSFTLDTSDLVPGTYRAYVHSDSPEGARIHSNQVEFTVID